MKRKIKRGVKVVKEHNKKISIFLVLLFVVAVYYFWNDIINTLLFLLEGFKKNWRTILLGFVSYKVVIINLSKRYAINKGVERFKKTLIYSEMDELISIWFSVISGEIKTKIKIAEELKFIGWFITFTVNILSWIIFVISTLFAIFKLGLGKLLITKVLSAQFWTAILVWLSNIPGFFTFLGVWIWIWIETKVPFIAKIYFWFSMKIRIILDPFWDRIEPMLNNTWDYILKVELRILTPIGDFIDDLEIKIINRIKEYIYYEKGEKKYNRYMKLVVKHNAKQLAKKEENEKERRVEQFTLLRKRAIALKKLNKSKNEN